jgi:hypothetical protein
MGQSVLKIDALPADSVKAAAAFYRDHLGKIDGQQSFEADALVIWLPSAPKSHDHWRRAAARDLARSHAPKRINIVGGNNGLELKGILAYLGDAPGITGQYLAAHE